MGRRKEEGFSSDVGKWGPPIPPHLRRFPTKLLRPPPPPPLLFPCRSLFSTRGGVGSLNQGVPPPHLTTQIRALTPGSYGGKEGAGKLLFDSVLVEELLVVQEGGGAVKSRCALEKKGWKEEKLVPFVCSYVHIFGGYRPYLISLLHLPARKIGSLGEKVLSLKSGSEERSPLISNRSFWALASTCLGCPVEARWTERTRCHPRSYHLHPRATTTWQMPTDLPRRSLLPPPHR